MQEHHQLNIITVINFVIDHVLQSKTSLVVYICGMNNQEEKKHKTV